MPMLYLPPVSYMALLCAAGEIQIESHENYIKSTYRNRCEILGANGIITLSIPIAGGRDHHQLYSESRISYTDTWQHQHLMSILSAYGSAPFYEHYQGYFRPLFSGRRYEHLYEFNKDLLLLMIKLMKLDVSVTYTDTYEKQPAEKTDLRHIFKANQKMTDLMISQKKWHLSEVPYIKVFGNVDVLSTNLSCLDLLFNTGPEAKDILRQMVSIS
ncbi:MAG: WbqC-like family protein [Bacteroidetes bacterium]|nr:WbqC-like family protein [Bacteroidota bacterium]